MVFDPCVIGAAEQGEQDEQGEQGGNKKMFSLTSFIIFFSSLNLAFTVRMSSKAIWRFLQQDCQKCFLIVTHQKL